jgi:hypothetical protein
MSRHLTDPSLCLHMNRTSQLTMLGKDNPKEVSRERLNYTRNPGSQRKPQRNQNWMHDQPEFRGFSTRVLWHILDWLLGDIRCYWFRDRLWQWPIKSKISGGKIATGRSSRGTWQKWRFICSHPLLSAQARSSYLISHQFRLRIKQLRSRTRRRSE